MRIIHLFADLCNLYGDYGNVCGLKRALENKGQNVEVEYQSIDDEIDVSGADFVFIGSATERNQKVALNYLQSYKDNIKTALDNGTVILATGNSFEIFGQSVPTVTVQSTRDFRSFLTKRLKEKRGLLPTAFATHRCVAEI